MRFEVDLDVPLLVVIRARRRLTRREDLGGVANRGLVGHIEGERLDPVITVRRGETTPRRVKPRGVDVSPRLAARKVEEPPKRKAGVKVPDAKTLVEKLRNEAKVIP